jgi:predicted nucleic acid-binding protein
MVVLDTNALICFFTLDDERKANQVKKLLDNEEEVFIPDVVFPEIEYVLVRTSYKLQKEDVIRSYDYLISHSNIKYNKYIEDSIKIFKNYNLDMADCIVAAISLQNNNSLATFDEALRKLNKNRYW